MIAVTGASGGIGGRAARSLAADGVPLRLVVRDASRAPDLDTEVAVAEYRDGAAMRAALEGAAPDTTFTFARDHAATEERIRASGLDHTFLRSCMYAEYVPVFASPEGVIRGPAGEGRAAFVARDDVADVAAAVLRAPDGHAGRTYDVTGPWR